ncbi:Beta-1,3-galactosyltransferase 7 [Acorus calamus]|uniref:Beta-1,3-galactosyltransferase 7 n=1 Tax=Acorus calamus TaxID=4465 RepID=A0AAV9FGB6_ACOCL|nr:Beta-1,3-galactosyltransferase 7 [Acorus calamus]
MSGTRGSGGLWKAFVVIGINTGFSRGILDRAIDAEEAETKDFLRLDHIEGYHELSAKTRLYFFTVVSI